MARDSQRGPFTLPGILLGLGLGGFVDGILLHQILQWHHMVSHVDDYPTTTVAGLEANTLGDGLFHAATWLFTVIGLLLLWTAVRRSERVFPVKEFVGLLCIGWGLFNFVEGIVDHHLLELHHVREDSNNQAAWDIAFLVLGAVLILVGWLLKRAADEDRAGNDRPRSDDETDTLRSGVER